MIVPIGLRFRIETRPVRLAIDASGEVNRDAEITGVQRIASHAVARRMRVALLDRVHGESARPVEPELIARPSEELEKSVAVSGRSMTEAGALAQRAGLPHQLARCEQHF